MIYRLAILLACLATAAAPTATLPVLILGDSLSQGLNASAPAYAYPAVLAQLLGREVVTLGASGRNLAGVVAQWDGYRSPLPETLVIEIGINDALNYKNVGMPLDEWVPTYQALIADALASGVRRVVVVTPGPLIARPGDVADTAAYADAVREFDGVEIVDTWPTMAGCAACYSADGVHPTDAGHAELARLLAAAIDTRVWLPSVAR